MQEETQTAEAPSHGAALTGLTVSLALFSASLFYSQSGISLFLGTSLLALLFIRARQGRPTGVGVPGHVMLAAGVYSLSLIVSVWVSTDRGGAARELSAVAYLLMAGLLYAAPLSKAQRRAVVIAYLTAAALAGVIGAMQYFSIVLEPFAGRAHGAMHPVHYGGLMAVALMLSIILLVVPKGLLSESVRQRWMLMAGAGLIALGLVLSQTRGAWLGFAAGGSVVLFIYRKRMALIFIGALVGLALLLVAVSPHMRWRMMTLYDAVVKGQARSETTGDRPVIWQGARLMFEGAPILGTGMGDFRAKLQGMIKDGRLPAISEGGTAHAHNIYLHWLATQGAVGLVALVGLMASVALWGYRLTREGEHAGYMLVFLAIFSAVWGMTETHLIVSRVFATYCLVAGILGRK